MLDWTKPHTIVRDTVASERYVLLCADAQSQAAELARWLAWIEQWCSATASRAEELDGHDKRESRGNSIV